MSATENELATQRELGRISAELGQALKSIDEIKSEVKELAIVITEAKGGWKLLAIICTAAATVGGLVASFLPF